MSVLMSRTIAENTLLNKWEVKALPFYENPESKALDLEHDDGRRQLRTMNSYPVGYDFSCNLIAKMKREGRTVEEGFFDNNIYYFAWITDDDFTEYLATVSDHEKRRTIYRQLQKDLVTGFVVVNSGIDKGGRYIKQIPPFRIAEIKYYEDNKRLIRIAWAKDIFESLITDSCTQCGADGYITIPEKLFPLATCATKAAEKLNRINSAPSQTHLIGSSNPIYRLEVFARMKNTNRVKTVKTSRKELLQHVAPEFLDKDGYLKKITNADLHDILQKEIGFIAEKLSYEYDEPYSILKNFYLGKVRDDESILYFDNRTAPQKYEYDDGSDIPF